MVAAFLTGCSGGVGLRVRPACPGPDGCGRVAPLPAQTAQVAARRPLEPAIDSLPLAPIPRSHPGIGTLRGRGSLSIGTVTTGFVVHDARLPVRGRHHRVLATQAARGLICGTDELVEAVQRAAASVARARPGALLTVGNVGRCGGGDIRWSVSHNSGRDVDLGFYLLGPDGRQHVPDNLVALDGNGEAVDGEVRVRFDPARNWLMVRAFLTDPRPSVQWMFVSRSLRRILLDHAAASGEPPELVSRAAEVLAQPARSRPHDDHFHVRIYCASDDLMEGCQDIGSNRSWHRDSGPRVDARMRELLRLSRSRDPAVRRDAAVVLGRMGRDSGAARLVAMLRDRDIQVARSAARGLAESGVGSMRRQVARELVAHPDDQVAFLLFAALRSVPRSARVQVLEDLLSHDRLLVADLDVFRLAQPVRDAALDHLCHLEGKHAPARLIEALRRPGVDVVAVDARLRELTGVDPDPVTVADPVAAWTTWWNAQKGGL